MLPLGTLSLGLWVIAVDPAFIAGHQSIKNCGIWIDQLDHHPAVMTTSFFLMISEHPWDKLRANLPHLQFLGNNCVYSSHTDIKLCSYCLYRHTTVLIHEILYLAHQLWCIDFLTPPISHRLPAFLESLMPLNIIDRVFGLSLDCGDIHATVLGLPNNIGQKTGNYQEPLTQCLHYPDLYIYIYIYIPCEIENKFDAFIFNFPVYIYIYIYIYMCVCVCVCVCMCVCSCSEDTDISLWSVLA